MKMISFILVFLFLSMSVFPQNFSRELVKKAESGDVEAMFSLGICYRRGRNVETDNEKAVYWFAKASDKGHIEATYYLASYYENGIVVKQDSLRAYNLLLKASDKGDAYAMFDLGEYRHLKSVPNSELEALEWVKKALETTDSDILKSECALKLYFKYLGTEGIAKDLSTAVGWLHKAEEYYPFSAVQNELGVCYLNGIGVDSNKEEAIKWFTKGYQQRDSYCAGNLGLIYYRDKDYNKAFKYLKESADNDFYPMQKAAEYLSYCYKYGRGTSVDVENASKYLELSKQLKDKSLKELME